MDYEIIGGLVIVLVLIGFGYYLGYVWGNAKKPKGVPDLRVIPPLPVKEYYSIKPTSETQYGRDLLEISTKIYLHNIGAASIENLSKHSVKAASTLISEMSEACLKIDKQKFEEAQKRSRELLKEMSI